MTFLKDILAVFYPENCFCCNTPIASNSDGICISCRHDLPFTSFTSETNNKLEKVFFGRIPIEAATALLYFQKEGPAQELMHNLKYRNKQDIGRILAIWLAKKIQNTNRFKYIDGIIPVPLHKKRFKERGYNQLTRFGETLAQELQIPYLPENLIRIAASKTQTKKFRLERWSNVTTKFHVKQPELFEGKHLLLIDDIVTTGATIEACYKSFNTIDSIKISLATMCYTK